MSLKLFLGLFLLITGVLISTAAIPGKLDPSFGSAGIIPQPYGGSGAKVAVQADQKIIVLTGYSLLIRYLPSGVLDHSFGNNGKVFLNIPGLYVNDLDIQTDGKIVVRGSKDTATYVLRYLSDGQPDPTLDEEGKLSLMEFGSLYQLDTLPNGKILLSGPTYDGSQAGFRIVRLNENGSLDASFGSNGLLDTFFDTSVVFVKLLVQSGGKFLSVGFSEADSVSSDVSIALARFNENGSLDSTFGNQGKKLILAFLGNSNSYAHDAALTPENQILVSAYSMPYSFLIRLTADGQRDNSFGDQGFISYDGGLLLQVIVQKNGKILATDQQIGFPNIKRLLSNGEPDPTFGNYGSVVTNFPFVGYGVYQSIALQSNGRIVGVGTWFWGDCTDSPADCGFYPAIARYMGDGDRAPFDYDGDGKSDFSVWRPSNGTWQIQDSSNARSHSQQWGLNGDKLTPADFDGDGKTDMAVWRPSNATWYVIFSADSSLHSVAFGLTGDIPIPNDCDGDGRADYGIWRPSNGTWYIGLSGSGIMYVQQWGLNGDKPAPADFDDDGKAELAVWRPAEGRWYVLNLTTGSMSSVEWGVSGDLPVIGDYNADGRADFSVYRPANQTWYVMNSNDYSFRFQQYGQPDEIPAPADFDGDGKIDFTVFKSANASWRVSMGVCCQIIKPFGSSGDAPTEAAFVY